MAGSESSAEQGDVEQVRGGAAAGNPQAVAGAAGGSALRDERTGRVEDVRDGSAEEQEDQSSLLLGHGAASSSEQDSQGPGEDAVSVEQRPQGSREEVPAQEQGSYGSKEGEQGPKEDEVSTQEQDCQGSVKDLGAQEQGPQDSGEDVPAQEQGSKEDVIIEEQRSQGAREDVPTEGPSKEDPHDDTGAHAGKGLAEEHASGSQIESQDKPEGVKQEADENKTATETVLAENKQAPEETASSDVKSTVELLDKLEIQESSDGASNDDDDVSSSIESTANSGAIHSQDDKAVSGDEEVSRRKKRVDLRHHFVRDIVKIQHDRDQFEKQCQLKKQEDFTRNTVQASSRTRSSGSVREDQDRVSSVHGGSRRSSRRSSAQATPRSPILGTPGQPVRRQMDEVKKQALPSVGYSSYMSPQDVRYQPDLLGLQLPAQYDKGKQPVMPLYRPPSLRDTDEEPIQVRGLPVASKAKSNERLPGNLKITFSAEGREVKELQSPKEDPSWKQPESTVGGKTSGSLPASFEFKAKAVGMQPRSDTSMANEEDNNNRRHRRSRNRNRSGSSSRTSHDSEVVRTPVSTTPTERRDNGALEVNARRIQRPEVPPNVYPVEKLPPKDKPFAGENTNSVKWSDKPFTGENSVKWSDIVDSEVEQSPRFDFGLENKSSRDRGRQKKPRQKKSAAAAAASKDPVAVAAGEQADQETPKKSVWERLGPRVSDSPRTLYFEQTRTESRLEGIRMPSERHYFCKDGEPEHDTTLDSADVVVRAAAAYKDAKQKRVRMELYVPRRGGVGGPGGGSST